MGIGKVKVCAKVDGNTVAEGEIRVAITAPEAGPAH
jgi:hypothetical protein